MRVYKNGMSPDSFLPLDKSRRYKGIVNSLVARKNCLGNIWSKIG